MTPEEREYVLTATGPGWRPLLEDLLGELAALNWAGEIHQVKEKFGTLRFYVGGGSEETRDQVYAAVDRADRKSRETCEDCGAPGKLRQRGWWKTRCDGCNERVVKDSSTDR